MSSWQDIDTPNIFHFHEEYLGLAGYNYHFEAPHFAPWEAFVATEPLTADPVFYTYLSV